jgi:thiamine-phosphate pyrophosphorylase
MFVRLPPLYPIVDLTNCPVRPETLVSILADYGINVVQLREKAASSRRFFEDVLYLVELAEPRGIRVIVNDRTDLAFLSAAQGVHLGQEDLPVEEARTILGRGRIIGRSTHNLPQALEAQNSSADYVAIGPVFRTSTKEKPDPVVSREELIEIRKRICKPLVAIGGITTDNVSGLFECGIDSVAVIRDLLLADNLAKKVSAFLQLWEATHP